MGIDLELLHNDLLAAGLHISSVRLNGETPEVVFEGDYTEADELAAQTVIGAHPAKVAALQAAELTHINETLALEQSVRQAIATDYTNARAALQPETFNAFTTAQKAEALRQIMLLVLKVIEWLVKRELRI